MLTNPLLYMGLGILANQRPTRYPQNFWTGVGPGLAQGLQMYAGAQKSQQAGAAARLKAQLDTLKLRQEQRKLQIQEQALAAATGGSGLTQTAVARKPTAPPPPAVVAPRQEAPGVMVTPAPSAAAPPLTDGSPLPTPEMMQKAEVPFTAPPEAEAKFAAAASNFSPVQGLSDLAKPNDAHRAAWRKKRGLFRMAGFDDATAQMLTSEQLGPEKLNDVDYGDFREVYVNGHYIKAQLQRGKGWVPIGDPRQGGKLASAIDNLANAQRDTAAFAQGDEYLSRIQRTLGEDDGSVIAQIRAAGRGAQSRIRQLQTLKRYLTGQRTGTGYEFVVGLNKLAQQIGLPGINTEEFDPDNAAVIESITNRLTLQFIGAKSEEAIPANNFSNKDLAFIAGIPPNTRRTPPGNALLVDIMLRDAELADIKHQMLSSYMRKNRLTPDIGLADFEAEWRQWLEMNGLTPDLRARIEAMKERTGRTTTLEGRETEPDDLPDDPNELLRLFDSG